MSYFSFANDSVHSVMTFHLEKNVSRPRMTRVMLSNVQPLYPCFIMLMYENVLYDFHDSLRRNKQFALGSYSSARHWKIQIGISNYNSLWSYMKSYKYQKVVS